MIRHVLLPASLLLAGLVPRPMLAQSAPVEVAEAWSRATPSQATTAAIYMTLTSPSGDTLLGVTTPAAQKAELHKVEMRGQVMEMRPLDGGLDLPAGQPVTLRPGGYHIMLEGLKAPLAAGQGVAVHLTFRSAPPMDVVARVGPIGASGPPR